MAMEMVLGASTALRPSPSLPKPTTPRPQLKPTSLSFPVSTSVSLLSFFSSQAHESRALTLPKDQLVSSITEVERTIDQVQELGSDIFTAAQRLFAAVTGALEPGIDAATPILRQAGEQAAKLASPVVSDASKKAQEAIESTGFDTGPVLTAVKTVADTAQRTTGLIDEAKPLASSTIESITSADPVVVLASAGVLYLTYLLFPSIWSAISFSLRGFKGELTAAQTLDLISTKNHLMIDIRSDKDKSKAGIPRLPSSAKNKMIAIPLEELPGKLRGLVRNVKQVEAEMVALKISYLKKIRKGSSIVIMDSYLDSAKMVARALTNLGYKNCWIVADGFSGRKGWVQSRLGVDSYNVAFPEVLSPSRIIPATSRPMTARRFGTASSSSTSVPKLLPGSSD